MPVPRHGPFCRSWTYPTSCWHCHQDIFVLQCSCGSAVLFDSLGWPWPEHNCTVKHGGWTSVGALPELVDEVKGEPSDLADEPTSPNKHDTRRIDSEHGESRSLLAVVRELHPRTNRIKDIEDKSEIGRQIIGLEPGVRYWQITFVNTEISPSESFTALVREDFAKGLNLHVMVRVEMSACAVGDWAGWRATDIRAFQ